MNEFLVHLGQPHTLRDVSRIDRDRCVVSCRIPIPGVEGRYERGREGKACAPEPVVCSREVLADDPFLLVEKQETLRRDLFLLGLDQVPVVAAGIAAGGLKKGETLAFTMRGGKGSVSWGDRRDDLAAPLDVARAFFEFNFLGALLAQQVERASATVAAAQPSRQKR